MIFVTSTGAFDPQDDTNDYKNVFTIIVFCVLRIELFEWKWNFKECVFENCKLYRDTICCDRFNSKSGPATFVILLHPVNLIKMTPFWL